MSHRRTPKTVLIASSSLALVLKPLIISKGSKTGKELFEEFRDQNKNSFWNRGLSESMLEISYLGWFDPGTMFIQGNEDSLDNLREAFSRRVLKPPRNYKLEYLGDVHPIYLSPVAASHFIPLTEVLCLIIAELVKRQEAATKESIHLKLQECYEGVAVPSDQIITKSLDHLVTEKKVYRQGPCYYIVVPEGAGPAGTPPTPSHTCVHQNQQGMTVVDKGTQTKKSKSDRYARSKSLPPNASEAAALERSLSVREKSKTLPVNHQGGGTGFERSKSMHMPHGSQPVDLTNGGAPSSFALSKLFRKSGKKGKKGEEKGSKVTELKTYSAQFPPEGWPAQTKGDVGPTPVTPKTALVKRLARVEAVDDVAERSPARNRRDRVHFRVPSATAATTTAGSGQQARSYSVEDTVPESEAEFIKPTKLYDDKYRTRVVSEQLRRQGGQTRLGARLLTKDCDRKRAAAENGLPRSLSHNPSPPGLMNDIPENGEAAAAVAAAAEGNVSRRQKRGRDRRRPTSVPRNLRLSAAATARSETVDPPPPAERTEGYANGVNGDFSDETDEKAATSSRQGAFRPVGDKRVNRVCAVYNSDSDLELALSLGGSLPHPPRPGNHPLQALDRESLSESSDKSLAELNQLNSTHSSQDVSSNPENMVGPGDDRPSTSQGLVSSGEAPVAMDTVAAEVAPPVCSPYARRFLHPRTRSSLSSAGDSGFNSPRNSVAGRHSSNSTPVEQLAYSQLTNGGGDPAPSTLTSNLTLNSSRSSSQNTVKSAPGFSAETDPTLLPPPPPPPAPTSNESTVLYKLGEV